MEKEIWAAIIQAVPVVGAAFVGFLGLNTWQKQLREGRQVEHAENALGVAGRMFPAVRAARSPLSTISAKEAGDRAKLRSAQRRVTAGRLNMAWDAWRLFQSHYALARLYTDPARPQLDVAHDVADCLYDLQDHAEMMWLYEEDDDSTGRGEHIKARQAFYGRSKPDPIEEQLSKAEAALQGELRPILLPKTSWFKRHWQAAR